METQTPREIDREQVFAALLLMVGQLPACPLMVPHGRLLEFREVLEEFGYDGPILGAIIDRARVRRGDVAIATIFHASTQIYDEYVVWYAIQKGVASAS